MIWDVIMYETETVLHMWRFSVMLDCLAEKSNCYYEK